MFHAHDKQKVNAKGFSSYCAPAFWVPLPLSTGCHGRITFSQLKTPLTLILQRHGRLDVNVCSQECKKNNPTTSSVNAAMLPQRNFVSE
jgi:hypothetical protein